MKPLSASCLEAFTGEGACARYGGFTYIHGLRSAPGPAAELGTRVHSILERVLSEPNLGIDTSSQEGKIAAAMSKFLPEPGSVPRVEEELSMTVDGIPFTGYIDAITDTTFFDHKTTSSRRWAKTKKSLSENIQFTLYARYLDEDYLGQWTYGLTKPSEDEAPAWAVRLPTEKKAIREKFKLVVLEPAHRVLRYLEETDANDLAPNWSKCDNMFGSPCPHKVSGACRQISDREKWKMLIKKTPLLEKLRMVDDATFAVAKEKLRAEVISESASMDKLPALREKLVDLINPPPMPVDPEAALTAMLKDPPAETPKKRGRKPKSEQPITRTYDDAETYARAYSTDRQFLESTAPTAEEIPSKPPLVEYDDQVTNLPNKSTFCIGTLFVNCYPISSPNLVYAHTLIAKAAEETCNDLHVLDVRMVDFGKGTAALAAQLKHDLQTNPVESLHINSKGSSEASAVLQTLLSLAENIVMGV